MSYVAVNWQPPFNVSQEWYIDLPSGYRKSQLQTEGLKYISKRSGDGLNYLTYLMQEGYRIEQHGPGSPCR